MKNTVIKFIFLLALVSVFLYLYISKANENLRLKNQISEYVLLKKQLKIKFLDYADLVYDKNSEIKYQKNKLELLNEFIKNFYFGNQSSEKNNLLEFFNNKKQFTVFKKGNNIVVGDIMFVYQDNTLVSLMVYD